jgi:hypothetical protein
MNTEEEFSLDTRLGEPHVYRRFLGGRKRASSRSRQGRRVVRPAAARTSDLRLPLAGSRKVLFLPGSVRS